MKTVNLIHREKNEECFEILKSTIIEDKELKKYRIDKDTLLNELPESIVNEFLDFLGSDERHRNLMLYMIKTGSLVIECWEDEDDRKDNTKKVIKKSVLNKDKQDDSVNIDLDSEVPF